jgi:hypothetical protein
MCLRKWGKFTVRPEDLQLMEAVVARENMLDAYSRVMSNKGAAGVDKMPVEGIEAVPARAWGKDQARAVDRHVPTAGGAVGGDPETERRSAAIGTNPDATCKRE